MPVPRVVWQTYRVPLDELTRYALEAAGTWVLTNPDWDYAYMDDEEASAFVRDEYGPAWHRLFVECPVGVMRADLWRYLVVHRYGGVYADLDTRCLAPIETWLGGDEDLVVAPEDDHHLCNWTFAAPAGHAVLAAVLDEVLAAFAAPDYTNPHFVHALTGPAVWTRGILRHLGLPTRPPLDPAALNARAAEVGAHVVCHESSRTFNGGVVQHLFGSQNWRDGWYARWVAERAERFPDVPFDIT